ncbi:unnamed protein product [Urochloa humidicola]
MAAADGQRLWDLSRRAASFLRMARLALTGAAAPAHLIAEGEVIDGHICDPCYKSISTEEEEGDWESDGIWAEDEESELLVDDVDGGSTTTRAVVSGISARGAGPLNKKSSQFMKLRPAMMAAGAALPSEDVAAAEESSEPLMERRRAAKR